MELSEKILLVGLLMGMFLAAIETSVVTTAMPKAISSLGGIESYSWVFTAYFFASTISGPLWGRISDLRGRRHIYVFGIALFLAGSALSGASSSMIGLVLSRTIQGIGAGAILVLTFTIIGGTFHLEERARVQGYSAAVWAIASIFGPPIGGFIADSLGWRWIFYINLPFGIVAMIIIWNNLREEWEKREMNLDLKGACLFTLWSGSLLLFLNEFSTLGNWSFLLLAVSIVSLTLFIRTERRSDEPLIPLKLFDDVVVRTSAAGNFLGGFAFFGCITYLPLLLQWVMGLSTTVSGIGILPATLGWVVASIIATTLLVRIGMKPVAISAAFLSILGTGLIAITTVQPNVFYLAIGGTLVGAGMGATSSTLLVGTQTLVRSEVLGVVTSLLSFCRLLGAALGVALMWIPISRTVLAFQIDLTGTDLILAAGQKHALSGALGQAFAIALLAVSISLPIYLLLPKIKLRDQRGKE